jgi:hypothetical protein
MTNATNYLQSKIRNEPEVLGRHVTRADLVDVLKRLRFDVDEHCAIWLDRSVRDFLVTALTTPTESDRHVAYLERPPARHHRNGGR